MDSDDPPLLVSVLDEIERLLLDALGRRRAGSVTILGLLGALEEVGVLGSALCQGTDQRALEVNHRGRQVTWRIVRSPDDPKREVWLCTIDGVEQLQLLATDADTHAFVSELWPKEVSNG